MMGLVPLRRLMPSTPGCFKCNFIVPNQCLAKPFLHKIAMGSAILSPSAILISLSLACVNANISSCVYCFVGF